MNKSTKSDYFTYVDEFTGKTVKMHKYFYTQPERDFEAEKRVKDYWTLTNSFISNPNYIEDTYNFFKTKNISAGEFIREFDMLKIKKRKLSNIQEEYEKTKKCLGEENEKTIIWNDKDISIEWPATKKVIVSEKDQKGVAFKKAQYFK